MTKEDVLRFTAEVGMLAVHCAEKDEVARMLSLTAGWQRIDDGRCRPIDCRPRCLYLIDLPSASGRDFVTPSEVGPALEMVGLRVACPEAGSALCAALHTDPALRVRLFGRHPPYDALPPAQVAILGALWVDPGKAQRMVHFCGRDVDPRFYMGNGADVALLDGRWTVLATPISP